MRPVYCWIALLLTVLLVATVVPRFLKARPQGSLIRCEAGMKNIATALGMYAHDNGAKYPTTLQKLPEGSYLRQIPTCPAAGSDTYSQTYHSTARVVAGHDTFQFYCKGHNHDMPPNHPRYDSDTGLILR